MTTHPGESDDDGTTPPSGEPDHGHADVPGQDAAPGSSASLDDAEVDRRFASILDQLGVGEEDASGYRASALGTAPVERVVRPGPPEKTPGPPDEPREHEPRDLGPRDHVVDEHPEDPAWGIDGFVEPDPPGPNLSDPGAILGWVAALGPLVVGLVLGIVGRPPTVLLMLLGLAVTIAGVVLLVRRLPDERGHGSDGAEV